MSDAGGLERRTVLSKEKGKRAIWLCNEIIIKSATSVAADKRPLTAPTDHGQCKKARAHPYMPSGASVFEMPSINMPSGASTLQSFMMHLFGLVTAFTGNSCQSILRAWTVVLPNSRMENLQNE